VLANRVYVIKEVVSALCILCETCRAKCKFVRDYMKALCCNLAWGRRI
jgi:hypothetical protein